MTSRGPNDRAPDRAPDRASDRALHRGRLALAAPPALLGPVVMALALALGQPGPARAADAPAPLIYSCVDAAGKRLTSDRPIAECNAREQRVLNADGSVKRVLPPTLTADERADAEAHERDVMAERAARQDAIRRDRNLMLRFPDEAAHRKARESALDDVRKALRLSESRVAALQAERKPLMDEAEFYAGNTMPRKLKGQIDANDASLEAQRALVQNQQLEVVRINKLYDAELERVKKLWSGAQPGSMRVIAKPAAAQTAASTPRGASVAGVKPASAAASR